ncbi:UNVERIFIED_CONTAM: 1-aminocyclopropane-1-carboxylate synthase 3 [Sesamum calycinum]|uniref:1-aminocyclopropane-1-carboxylate synthase 3 n=1 Tax=Sesamum calycinum TaxID=2727403 RepID=A0AAW2PBU2_9LAMI
MPQLLIDKYITQEHCLLVKVVIMSEAPTTGKATCKSHGEDSSYFLGWQEYEKNPHHPVRNPCGIIQLGLAENQLCFDLLESWIARNQEPTGFMKKGGSIFRELALFQDYRGMPVFKKVSDDNWTCIGSKSTWLQSDKTRFDRDLKWRTGVEIVPIQSSSVNNFRIIPSALEEAYQHAQKLHLKVKGLFITNPSNPLGTTLSIHELDHLINFAIDKNIHIVSDEIYSGTVFDSPRFISIMEAVMKKNLENTAIWRRVHIVSSLSKDFGLPGFRIGMIYSNSKTLIAAATKMSSFGLVSSQSQFLLSRILGDKKFTRNYIMENRKRLKNRRKTLVSGLQKLGIRCLENNAGLFCWIDMRCLLTSYTFEAEMELWRRIIFKYGLNISPGSSFHCPEPGMLEIACHEILVARVAGRENGSMTLGLSFLEDHKPWGRKDRRKSGKALLSFRQQVLIDRDSFYEKSEEETKNLKKAFQEIKSQDISEEIKLSLKNVKKLIWRNFSENPLAW